MDLIIAPASGYERLGWDTFADELTQSNGWSHSGAAVLPDGRVAIAPTMRGSLALVDTRAPRGASIEMAPAPIGVGHGILATGTEVIVADVGQEANEGQVIRLGVRDRTASTVAPPAGAAGRWRPTSIALDDAGSLWVADGYGDSRVWILPSDGDPVMIDGSDTGTLFDCPHGLLIDDRADGEARVIVADRGNRRLVFLRLDGTVDRVVTHPLLTSPSCLARRGADVLITDLFGALLRLGENDDVDAILPRADEPRDAVWPNRLDEDGRVVAPLLKPGVLRSPHGVAVDSEGTIYLTEWMLGGRQVRLTVEA